MPQDIESCVEHELIRKNVESLVAAVNAKTNGEEVSTENVVWLDSFSQKWQEFERKNIELLCHIDFFEKTFEAQEKSAFASTTTEIEKLLESNKKLESVFTSHRAELDSFHSTGKELIEISRRTQDLERAKNLLDSGDAQWNHFLSSLKGQTKFLESKLDAFSGFDANLRDFVLWLNNAETALQYFNDDITEEEALRLAERPEATVAWKPFKKIQNETDDNETKIESLNSIGTQILIGLKTTEAKETVQAQLNDVNERWNQLKNKCKVLQKLELKQNQEKQEKAFNLLLQKLIELDIWLKYLEDEFSALAFPSEADSSTFQSHVDRSETLQHDVEAKSSQVENYFLLGKRSLAKASEQLDPGPEELHLLTETVTEHLNETESKWMTMREKIQHHCSSVTKTAQRLLTTESQLVKMKEILSGLESLKSSWLSVDEIPADNLQSAVNEARSFEVELMPVKIGISDCHCTVQLLKSDSVTPSIKYLEELKGVKESLQFLEASVEDRLNALMITALKKIPPTTNHQPLTAVNDESPWKRSSDDDKEALCHSNTSPPLTNGSTATIEMHSRIELCANRLAELEKRSETQLESEDEHELIGRLCDSLSGRSSRTLPLQQSQAEVVMSFDVDQKSELDVILSNLEEENRALQSQYDLLKIESKNLNSRLSSRSIDREETRSIDSRSSDREMIAETQILRSYKDRLENRMCILEDHNDRLTSQLHRLRQLLTGEGGGGQGQRDNSFPSKRSISAPGTPSLTSLRQRKTPTHSSSMRGNSKRLARDRALFSSDQKLTNGSSSSSRTGRPVGMSQDSLGKDSSFGAEDDDDDPLFDIAKVGKELNRLIDGITSGADSSPAKDHA